MSIPTPVNISCPQCGKTQEFTVWRSVNVTVDPEVKEVLLKGKLTTFRCKSCGHEAIVPYDTIYHDMDRQFMIFLFHQEVPTDLEKLLPLAMPKTGRKLFRLVRSWNELLEKVFIFDAELDDRLVEALKLAMRRTILKEEELGELLFQGVADNQAEKSLSFAALSNRGNQHVSVAWACYEAAIQACEGVLPGRADEAGKLLRVDAKNIESLDELGLDSSAVEG